MRKSVDIDEAREAIDWLAGQNHALELIASGAPLASILDHLVGFIEAHARGLVASVLLLKDGHLVHGAAPSLASEYTAAIDGVAIGPHVGSCGAAAFFGRPVVSPDLATDPNWTGFRDLALRNGLRACWSTPILAGSGEVLGTFALYYGEPGAPPTHDVRLVDVATHVAGIAIIHHRNAEALRLRAQELQADDRRKDEFLAMLAHELRNPLTPILNALALMQARGGDPSDIERYRQIIERQTRHLCRLVDDLLDVSRITRGKITLDLARVTAAELIERARETASPTIEARSHHLSIELPDVPVELEVDPVRIAQVLANILNNAAKFTAAGGHIALRAHVEAGHLLISVKDDGAGISPEMLPRIFDLFTQAAPALDRSLGGLGIGLTLARRLVEMHGGRLTAHSAGLGEGSEFLIRLPLTAAHQAASEARRTSAPRRVLIVDDNADAADMLSILLEDAGHAVHVARDGHAGLTAVAAWRPDVVLLDIGLPGLDGHEVARRIRAEHGSAIRLVALTGHALADAHAPGASSGFDAHLTKPVDSDALLAAITAE